MATRCPSGPRSWSRPPPPAKVSRRSWRGWIATAQPAATGSSMAPDMARAEAQVWAIVSERLRDRFHGEAIRPAAEWTLRAVAEHRLDPYTAADRLLASLVDPRTPA